ncbi:hypothetical protein [Cohnella boryungensis]|uniref:Rhodanese domain-containing protein n=1 Tax=Cohnella boryungensis TaxID=768479 RepID=A0ABV8SCP9_9BACL
MSPEQLREDFGGFTFSLDEIVVYCGSGYTRVKLYAGGWSDWITWQDNPIAVGDEEKPSKA